jgi:glycerol-3-phosphate acyltransferase PlsY
MIDALGLILVSGSYLSGSVPFGLLLTRWAGHGDVRQQGSGNIGATNVLRTAGKKLGALTLLCDALKGAIPVTIAQLLVPEWVAACGLAALCGHLFPVWLRFRGGKGVATALGVMLAAAPLAGALTCLTWLVTARLFRISSLAALISIGAMPLYAWVTQSPDPCDGIPCLRGAYAWVTQDQGQSVALGAIMAVAVILRHHANIRRILSGTEPKIGQKT